MIWPWRAGILDSELVSTATERARAGGVSLAHPTVLRSKDLAKLRPASGQAPATQRPELSVVIPTYRQSDIIGDQVRDVLRALDQLECAYDVLVVVDGDGDGSANALSRVKHRCLRVTVQERNTGKGSAVRRGLLGVNGQARAFLDGGGDIPPVCLIDAYRTYVESDADVVVGSKLHPESVVDYPIVRRIYSWGYRLLTRLLFGLSVRDTQVGLKIYSAPVVQSVFPHVRTSGFAFDIEALALAIRLGFRSIVEAPVIVKNRYPSSIRPTTIATMFLETLMVAKRLRSVSSEAQSAQR